MIDSPEDSFGLSLDEGKAILKSIQQAVLQDQVEELCEVERVCPTCHSYLRVHDRRKRQIDTLFGRVTVEAPRIRICMCRFPHFPEIRAAFSPLSRILPDKATPELRRLQAELGARFSFREAAQLLNELTPCARQNHATIRNRLSSVAEQLEAKDDAGSSPADGVVVFLDSAYVRSRPEYQRRNFEVIVGSIETVAGEKRRFGLGLGGVERPADVLRSNLTAAGWEKGTPITVLSDGDAALPRLVRDATGTEITHILDWWHISARIRHVETTFKTLLAAHDGDDAPEVARLAQRLRWRIWNGQVDHALEALHSLFHFAFQIKQSNEGWLAEAALSAASRAEELKTYLEYNISAVVNYGERRRSGNAVSTSRAEGLVNEIANVRMGKKQRMRWSPEGAHRVATVRAAVLDARLSAGRELAA